MHELAGPGPWVPGVAPKRNNQNQREYFVNFPFCLLPPTGLVCAKLNQTQTHHSQILLLFVCLPVCLFVCTKTQKQKTETKTIWNQSKNPIQFSANKFVHFIKHHACSLLPGEGCFRGPRRKDRSNSELARALVWQPWRRWWSTNNSLSIHHCTVKPISQDSSSVCLCASVCGYHGNGWMDG